MIARYTTKDKLLPFREMKAAEFNRAMEALGLLTDLDRAQFLRCVIRTAWGYGNGDRAIPRCVAMLLRLALARNLSARIITEATE